MNPCYTRRSTFTLWKRRYVILPDHAGKRWATVVQQKLVENNIFADIGEELDENSERYAQLIFQNPLARMLNALQEETSNE